MLLKYVLVCLITYGLGNFATSYVVGRIGAGIDIRKYGSGNAGATNTLRVLGMKMGLLTFVGDALKGALAVLIGYLIAGENGKYLAGVMVVMGHIWPIALGFRGGKGVATTVGVVIAAMPLYALFIVPPGIALIIITRYVSLTSILGMFSLPLIMLIRGENAYTLAFGIAIAAMSIFAHRTNLIKLLTGKESKIEFKRKEKKED